MNSAAQGMRSIDSPNLRQTSSAAGIFLDDGAMRTSATIRLPRIVFAPESQNLRIESYRLIHSILDERETIQFSILGRT